MSLKLLCVLIIFTLATFVLIVEARGGRGRGGSLGSTFYRRSHKKHSQSGGTSSRRKTISGSPVHTTYTKSLIADQKFVAKHSSGRSRSHSSGHSLFGGLFGGSKSHSSSSSHSSGSSSSGYHSSGRSSYNSHTRSHNQPPHHYTSEHRTHSWGLHSSSPSHHSQPHVSHQWGGQRLKPNHVYVTQPSSMPANVIYYAQPPTYSSNSGGSTDFAFGYLVGRSLSHGHHHHHQYHHHYNSDQQESEQSNSNSENSNTSKQASVNKDDSIQANSTNQTNYWPTDYEVPLAPLNVTLIPETVTAEAKEETIFKKPPIVSAQTISVNNISFELPTATAAPPETPPEGGIICMPWTFNETDSNHPEHVETVTKTICFPAPPPPPLPTTTTTIKTPIAGDISNPKRVNEDRCDEVKCPSIFEIDFSIQQDPCCLTDKKLLESMHLPFG